MLCIYLVKMYLNILILSKTALESKRIYLINKIKRYEMRPNIY